MTEICFGSIKMEIFYRDKAFHTVKKKSGEMTLPPMKNIPLTPLPDTFEKQDVIGEIYLSVKRHTSLKSTGCDKAYEWTKTFHFLVAVTSVNEEQ